MLENAEDVDEIYIREVLPGKMSYNLNALRNFSLLRELKVMLKTVGAVLQ